uniref:Phosphatidate cytidylyltransferase n=1 Tax=Hirondellea gigas TaxID=1518452 RepID=A0A6A7G8F5_9CRUS
MVLTKRKTKRHEEDTSGYESDSDIDKSVLSPAIPPREPPRDWTKIRKRTISAFTMISGFAVVIYGGHTALAILVSILQAMMFQEIVNIGARRRKEQNLPGFRLMHWYWFFCTIFFVYGRALMRHIVRIGIVRENFEFVVHYHTFISFSLLTTGFIFFVISLRKGFYRVQFKQLGWCFLTILIVCVQATFTIVNIFQGLIWFILPTTLVFTNDMFAWLFGTTLGRTRLIILSPKKTWEGFIGGTIATVIISSVLAHFMAQSLFLICPKTGFDFDLEPMSCTPDAMFIVHERHVFSFLETILLKIGLPQYSTFYAASFQFHALVLSLFASIIAPFGGFFASGFKRAFRIKDFGDSIPGHGGITDRFDCQLLMGLFVYVYTTAFTGSTSIDVNYVVSLYETLDVREREQFLQLIHDGFSNF